MKTIEQRSAPVRDGARDGQSPSGRGPSGQGLFGPGQRPLRWGAFSFHGDLRAVGVFIVLLTATAAVGWWGLISGSSQLGMADAFAALTGTADEGTARVILDWRLPRVVFTVLGGAALAVSGAVFQSQTRNPLGSPDIIGFSTGAYTGALLLAVLGISGLVATPIAAILGGLGTGVLIYLLAWKRGVSGLRIIIVGIGVSIFLGSLNTYLVTTLSIEDAVSVATWGAGSVNDITWNHVWPVLGALVVILPVMLSRAREMTFMEMGDDASQGLGIRIEAVRLVQYTGGIVLVAVVTAAAGPIAFVALVAPQVAMRLTRSSSVQLLPAAAMGALLLTASDLLARSPVLPMQPPVGVVTLCLGGAYLVWLLTGIGRITAGPRKTAGTRRQAG